VICEQETVSKDKPKEAAGPTIKREYINVGIMYINIVNTA